VIAFTGRRRRTYCDEALKAYVFHSIPRAGKVTEFRSREHDEERSRDRAGDALHLGIRAKHRTP
jgi:hypothetical protein